MPTTEQILEKMRQEVDRYVDDALSGRRALGTVRATLVGLITHYICVGTVPDATYPAAIAALHSARIAHDGLLKIAAMHGDLTGATRRKGRQLVEFKAYVLEKWPDAEV